MANTLLTPDVIAREALMVLESNMVAANLVYRDYETEFTGAKVGDTITIRKPPSFSVNEYNGSSLVVQDIKEGSLPLTLDKHFDVSVAITTKELSLELDSFSRKVVQPAMLAFAERIDTLVYEQYTGVNQFVGTAGTYPNSIGALAAIDEKLNEARTPLGGRFNIMNPKGKASLMSIPDLVRADARGDNGTALREASLGRSMGLDHFMAQNIRRHTSGALAGTPTASAAAGATVVTIAGAGANGTVKKGDLVTFAGDIDAETGFLNQYVVTADAAMNGSGAGTFAVYPALKSTVASAAVTQVGSHAANLAGHGNGIALAVVPLELPMGAANAAAVSNRGLSIRVVMGYDMQTKTDTISFDMLCAAKVIDPRLLVRVLG